MRIENCPDVCKRPRWHPDPVFEGSGQWNCPYRFHVDYAAAIIDGKANCEHFERKEKAE